MLNGQSPQERAADKLRLALGWLGLFHYSTEGLIKRVLNIKGSGLMSKLEHKRLARPVPVYSISSQRVWVLTPAGVIDASIATCRDIQYPHNPERIAGNFLKHNLLVQRSVIPFLPTIDRDVRTILPARLLATGSWGDAIPDVLFGHQATVDGVVRTALEVELTYKKAHELDAKFQVLSRMLAEDAGLRVQWIFPTQAMSNHYRKSWDATRDQDLDVHPYQVSFEHDTTLSTVLKMCHSTADS